MRKTSSEWSPFLSCVVRQSLSIILTLLQHVIKPRRFSLPLYPYSFPPRTVMPFSSRSLQRS